MFWGWCVTAFRVLIVGCGVLGLGLGVKTLGQTSVQDSTLGLVSCTGLCPRSQN